MRLDDLRKYGMTEALIDIWRHRQGDKLLPIQSRAVRHGLLDQSLGQGSGRNMIVSAPTSAGKSFCAELAALHCLSSRKRVVMLFPLKSLAEEKYRLMRASYSKLGIKCLIVTGDHPENDRRFMAGDYQIAIAIYEKFDLALAARLDLLRTVGLIVIDEIQIISESRRGAVLERLLTKVIVSTYQPRLVALSAVLADRQVAPLADWLEADLVEETIRPRDLIRGIAAEGQLNYRSYNDSQEGSEPFAASREDGSGNRLLECLKATRASNQTTLVFLKSRADCVRLALESAAVMKLPPAEAALESLADEEPSFLVRSLSQALSHGVAFHNSDLSSKQREIVEEAFTGGEVGLLCSTTTLALGVNLPADVVYLETVKYVSGEYGGRPELVPISRAEFDNMTGRAGRLGGNEAIPGRAVILAESSFDSDVLWQAYLAPTDQVQMESAFANLPLDDWLLHLIVSGLASQRDDLDDLLGRTFYGHLKALSGGESTGSLDIDNALAALKRAKLLNAESGDQLLATGAGSAAARAGLSARQATYYLEQLHKITPESPFGWTCLALSAPEWSLPPSVLSWYEQSNNMPVRMLYQRFDHSVEEAVPLLPANHRREPVPFRAAAALKSALIMDEWCRLTPVPSLEEKFQMHLGQIQNLGRGSAHLVASLAAIIRSSDQDSAAPELLGELGFSLRFGLPFNFEEMHRQIGHLLSRSDFLRLHKQGIATTEELAQLSQSELERLLGGSRKCGDVIALLNTIKEGVDMQPAIMSEAKEFTREPRSIEIDGSFEDDRYLVRIDGFPVKLTGKSFKYLAKLAWSRLNDAAGWVYKEDIEVGFNQARYLYRMKNEIQAGFKSNWSVVENNRLGYYRLRLDPRKIRLNTDNLKDHPDYELRQLFSVDNGPGAVH